MAIHSQTFAIITNRLIVKCWKKWNIRTKFEKNRDCTKWNRTKRGLPVIILVFKPAYWAKEVCYFFRFLIRHFLLSFNLSGTHSTKTWDAFYFRLGFPFFTSLLKTPEPWPLHYYSWIIHDKPDHRVIRVRNMFSKKKS